MSLWGVHRFFIVAAIALCILFAVQQARQFAPGNLPPLLRAAASAAGAVALTVYLRKLRARGRQTPGGAPGRTRSV